MDAVVWIAEESWEACVDHARVLLPEDAHVTLLYVCAADAAQLALHPGAGHLGRHRRSHEPPPVAVSHAAATALLEDARARFGRDVELRVARGRVEREVVAASAGADLLVLARDGERRLGPPSLGRWGRFIVDHAPCDVALVWPSPPHA
jgi:nucleotide-binding universal stress UspA family protein